jgi:hypothetical protein
MMPFDCALKNMNSHKNKTKMQNVYAFSIPEFQALSNCTIVFALSLILCTGKSIKRFTDIILAFNLHFSIKDWNYRKTKCTIQKSVQVWVETT